MSSFQPPASHFLLRLSSFVAVLALFLTLACNSLSPASTAAPLSLTPTLSAAAQADNPTAAAIRRATRQAQATRDSQATQAPLASQTAEAAAKATQTAEAQDAGAATSAARATVQAIYAAEHTWSQRVAETFADNQLGWPVGLTQDQYLAVTSTVAGGRYQWITQIASTGAYTNLAPAKGPALADFYAAVTVRFVQGNDDGQAAYGLAFRLVNQDFGFFGVLKSGQFLAMETHNSNVDQTLLENSSAIDTQPGATNRIGVVGVGSDFVCLVNDQVVSELTANLAPGQVGLGVEGLSSVREAQVDFSDFEIRTP
jgi:hypothetical protein